MKDNPWVCPYCNHENIPHSTFCAKCNIIRMSKNTMLTYKYCPHRFKVVMIDKIKPLTNYRKQMGKDFHQDAQDFFPKIDINELLEIGDYRSVVDYMSERTKFSQLVEFESRRWWRYYREDAPWDYIPKLLEVKMEVPWIDNEEMRSGILDRLDVFGRHRIIIEYKAKLTRDIKMELAFYYLMVNKHKPGGYTADRVGCFEYDHPELGWNYTTWEVHTNSIRAVGNLVAKIKADTVFKRNKNSCAYCDVSHVCMEEPDYDED